MFFVKKWRFLNLQSLCRMDDEKVFCEGSERKEAFLHHKNIGSKSNSNLNFFKGVSPWFQSKNEDFLIFSLFAERIKKKGFVKVPKGKKPFQTIKTSAQKTTKICIFFGQWFLSKKGDFLVFSFYAKWIKKRVL